jgi:hypothetical protein
MGGGWTVLIGILVALLVFPVLLSYVVEALRSPPAAPAITYPPLPPPPNVLDNKTCRD